MGTCGSCHGSGKVTCSGCGGRGRVSRFGAGGVEINTCLVCGGKRRIRCNFCGGRGQISISTTTSRQSWSDDPRQTVREGFQSIFESCKDSSILAVMLAAYCVGCNEKYNDLDLPTQKALKVMQSDGDTFQMVVKDFVEALELDGWIE